MAKPKHKSGYKLKQMGLKGRLLLFVVIFGLMGGAYLLYKSFAATRICTTFKGPTVIDKGATYEGRCWTTTDGVTPAITIKTTEPVIIKDSTIVGNHILVTGEKGIDGINLTIQNTKFYGVDPTTSNPKNSRRAILLNKPSNLLVQNNYFESTGGIKVREWTGTSNNNKTIKILNNKVKNITNKGVPPGERETSSQFRHYVQFLQIGQISAIAGVQIAWNEVINTYGESSVEDNINLFKTGGTSDSPIRIHDNFIWGGYPKKVSADISEGFVSTGYSGGGILVVDGEFRQHRTPNEPLIGQVNIEDNQVIGTTNYGVSIVCGVNNNARRNTVIASGQTKVPLIPVAGVTQQVYKLKASNLGLQGKSRCGTPKGYVANYMKTNTFSDNTVGWMNYIEGSNPQRWNRQDLSSDCKRNPGLNACAEYNKDSVPPTPPNRSVTPLGTDEISFDMEMAEYNKWLTKVSNASKSIGTNY